MISALHPQRDRDEWLQAWEDTGREPFAHPDYVALFVEDGGTSLALMLDQPGGKVLLPLVLRTLPSGLGAGDSTRDAISPYGYGGPFASGETDWRAFYAGVLEWMRESEVVSAFIRASLGTPAPALTDLGGYAAVHLADNVCVDLSRDDDEQWRQVAHKVRKNVKKARRAELSVRIGEGFTDLPAFLDVYESTMRRREADERYLFDEKFFSTIGSLPGCALVADVIDPSDRVVSTELVLVSDANYYSFLGGTREEAFVHAPNDLLKHAVMEHGHAQHKKHFVLGGGYQAGDGIFRYKLAFDSEGVVPFHGIQLVGDENRYDALVARQDELRGHPVPDADSWFPAYRHP